MEFESLNESQLRAVESWWQQNESEEFVFCDNFRYAVKGNVEQETYYNQKRLQGCCGFIDDEIVCDDGSVLLYGFNYGH